MTEEQEAKLAMFMRVVELFKKSEGKVELPEELKQLAVKVKENVDQIFALLTDEERDRVLERYKEDLEYLNGIDKK